jgi:hypothetical protein
LANLEPKVDVATVAPSPTKGKMLMEDGEAMFISQMIKAGQVPCSFDEIKAREVWKRLWDMVSECRKVSLELNR